MSKENTKVGAHREVMKALEGMMKTSQQASGVPGKETKPESMGAHTDHIDKNKVKPETLPQHYEQHKGKDDPTAKAAGEVAIIGKEGSKQVENTPDKIHNNPASTSVGKKAEETTPDATKLGNEILADIDKALEKESQQASGVVGKETHPESMGAHTDHIDKNKVKPENLPQHYEQHKGKDDPTAKAGKTAEELQKEELNKSASFALGAALAQEWIKQSQANELEMAKQAGRRDFEQLIAVATAELEQEKAQEKIGADLFDKTFAQEKLAEEQGAKAFADLMKQAAYDNEIETLRAKVAELEGKLAAVATEKVAFEKAASEAKEQLMTKSAALKRYEDDEREAQKMAQWAEHSARLAADMIEKKLRNSRD